MQDGGIDKPEAGESTSGTRTDPSEEVDFEGLSTLDEPVAETIVSTTTQVIKFARVQKT